MTDPLLGVLRRAEGDAQRHATCTITRGNDDASFDDETGTVTPPTSTTVYTGGCRVWPTQTQDRVVVTADEAVTVRSVRAAIPWDETDTAVDDVLTVTACDDPRLVDRPLRITDVEVTTYQAGRILRCEDILG